MISSFFLDVAQFLSKNNIEYRHSKKGEIDEIAIAHKDLVIKLIPLYIAQSKESLIKIYNTSDQIEPDVFYLYEDRWLNENQALKERILTRAGKGERIFARKCRLKSDSELSKEDLRRADRLLAHNHSLSRIKSKYTYILEYKENIVCVATFSAPKLFASGNKNYLSFEWTRYASHSNITVVGGMSRVLKAFIRERESEIEGSKTKANSIDYIEVMSYSDNEWSKGLAYKKIGFKEVDSIEPIAHYLDRENLIRITEDNFKKLAREEGEENLTSYLKIYNMGSRKWVIESPLCIKTNN